jgi:hypothetical protein
VRKKKFAGRTFNLLPVKAGFTISHIPISSMMMVAMLRDMGLEKFPGDGRDVDRDAIWRKHFNVNLVETRTRRFAHRIVTDGCAVSVLINKPTCIVCPRCAGSDEERAELFKLYKADKQCTHFVGIDPGVTDVVTVASRDGTVVSYSSAKYYENAGYNTSRRRVNAWTAETKVATSEIPKAETASLPILKANIKAYMARLPALLKHRAEKGFRNMRFMRYVGKKQAIDEICELIVPKGKTSVVGFGNWKGLGSSPISRRCAGPLQEIKLQLSGNKDVRMLSIDETRTSKGCHGCGHELTNMRAKHTKFRNTKDENGDLTRSSFTTVAKIHKVLHCRSSHSAPTSSGRCGATWNRDVNASKNILMLMMLDILGMPRPRAFCRGGV